MSSFLVYIGLGSNLEGPRGQVERALEELAGLPQSRLLRHSRLYRSAPLGPEGQPDYINAVAALETALSPLDLLDELQRIETLHGRVRGERWGARTLDLDLLLFGEERIELPRLKVPHPEMANRAFVLIPLAEIAPAGLVIPGLGSLDRLLPGVSNASLTVPA
jgi:2-amino-4-hydroxy-6-hydroxymethyldihydropteridine diphosphokinase